MSQSGSGNSPDLKGLFETATEEGVISSKSLQALTLVDMSAQINAGMGVQIDDVHASEVVLVTMLIDDSGSIMHAGNEQAVRDGHNSVLQALEDSKQQERQGNILGHVRYLNGTVLYPYCLLEQAVKMDLHNYGAGGGTPLYDQTVVVLGTVLAKAQEFAENGVPVRTVTLIVTDGRDEHSRRQTAASVASVVKDMLKTENHIVAAMGIDDGKFDFRQVFRDMGIPDEWILTPGNTPSEIRKAFLFFSKSAVRASQSAASFSQTAMGGFGK